MRARGRRTAGPECHQDAGAERAAGGAQGMVGQGQLRREIGGQPRAEVTAHENASGVGHGQPGCRQEVTFSRSLMFTPSRVPPDPCPTLWRSYEPTVSLRELRSGGHHSDSSREVAAAADRVEECRADLAHLPAAVGPARVEVWSVVYSEESSSTRNASSWACFSVALPAPTGPCPCAPWPFGLAVPGILVVGSCGWFVSDTSVPLLVE